MTLDSLTFNEFIDVLRQRIFDADALHDRGRFHNASELVADLGANVPEGWLWDAFEELRAQGHLHEQSTIGNGGDFFARLSADGRLYVREQDEGGHQ